jgi:hypothetical protein
MNAIGLHRRSATVVVFAMFIAALQVPAWGAPRKASITINDVQVTEGNAGTKTLAFTARIKGRRNAGTSVAWAAENVTATAGSDYVAGNGTVSFSSGKAQRINVTVLGDQTDEPNETLNVNLSGAVNATIADAQGVGTIVDDDEAATLSIADDVVGEGNSGATTPASFDVTLSKPLTTPVSVGWATVDGTATAGSDYRAASDTLTFDAGQTAKSVTIDVLGDDLASEADETFAVNLSAPVGANIADGVATGTIIDDEVLPAVSIGDATVDEGLDATATFPVTLSHPSAEAVAVDYATLTGSASAPADFDAVNDTLTFVAGSTARNIVVPIKDDTLDEPTENFSINLSNHPKALAADVQGRGVIIDDEKAPRVTVRDLSVTEGSGPAAAVQVELSHASSQDVVVGYAASDGSAKVTRDYGASAGAITFNSGQVSKTVPVPVVNDQVAEWRERFAVDVIETLNADLGDGAATVTIRDDDRKPSTTKVTKRIRNGRIYVTGRLSPAHKGRRMTVTLKKRSNGRWVSIRTKRPLLSRGIDVNKDGVLDSKYATRFFNPRNTKRCRIIARFAGDVHHFPSTARRTFHC